MSTPKPADVHQTVSVTLSIRSSMECLQTYTDEHLRAWWHIAQANPAPHGDREAGELVERIGREIIRRWMGGGPVSLLSHQGHSYYWGILVNHGKWIEGEWTPNPTIPTAPEVANP